VDLVVGAFKRGLFKFATLGNCYFTFCSGMYRNWIEMDRNGGACSRHWRFVS
jgi:hypothetical protein